MSLAPAMASKSCWKCLTRPSISSTSSSLNKASSRLPAIAAFSTTAPVASDPNKKKGSAAKPTSGHRQPTSLRVARKAPAAKSGKPPMPGERKALRKRIVLSNTNALEVLDVVDMKATLEDSQVGTVVGIPGPVVDQLRTVEAFKTTQGWGMFRRPCCLVRAETAEIVKIMTGAEAGKKTTMTVLDGDKGTGKSMVLLQAMATAFLKGWIVVNIPEAVELTAARTDYNPISGTSPTLYSQNTYIANLLGQIGKANSDILSKIELSKSHSNLPIPGQSNITLYRLAELGSRDPEIAWPLFQALWSDITAPGLPPILFTLDGLPYIMKDSAYRSPDFQLIHAHDLALIKLFVDYLSGTTVLPNGGSIIAAMTRSSDPSTVTMDLALKQQEERQFGKELTKADPFTLYDARVLASLENADLLKLKGLSKAEARGLMEYWAASGVLRQKVDDGIVSEKWTLAGNGVVGEIERGALRMRI